MYWKKGRFNVVIMSSFLGQVVWPRRYFGLPITIKKKHNHSSNSHFRGIFWWNVQAQAWPLPIITYTFVFCRKSNHCWSPRFYILVLVRWSALNLYGDLYSITAKWYKIPVKVTFRKLSPKLSTTGSVTKSSQPITTRVHNKK